MLNVNQLKADFQIDPKVAAGLEWGLDTIQAILDDLRQKLPVDACQALETVFVARLVIEIPKFIVQNLEPREIKKAPLQTPSPSA